jgi:hypothetical protein
LQLDLGVHGNIAGTFDLGGCIRSVTLWWDGLVVSVGLVVVAVDLHLDAIDVADAVGEVVGALADDAGPPAALGVGEAVPGDRSDGWIEGV